MIEIIKDSEENFIWHKFKHLAEIELIEETEGKLLDSMNLKSGQVMLKLIYFGIPI